MDTENLLLNPIDIIEDVIHQKNGILVEQIDHELVAEISSNGVHIGFISIGLKILML